MITCMNWPGDDLKLTDQLGLNSKAIQQALLVQLTTPFASEEEAQSFWRETSSCLVIIEPDDSEASFNELPDHLQQQLLFCVQFPEEVGQVYEDWLLYLAILNDEGAGIYLLAQAGHPFIEWLENHCHE
jgi:hypothetical protein